VLSPWTTTYDPAIHIEIPQHKNKNNNENTN